MDTLRFSVTKNRCSDYENGGFVAYIIKCEAGAPQNTPPNAVASRTEIGEGNLPPATQNAPQAQETANTGDVMEREAQRLFGQEKTAPTEGAESTAINDDPMQHTAQEQRVIEAYKESRDDKLRGFIERVRVLVNNDYRNKIRATIDVVSNRAAEKAGELTGVDTTGFVPIIKGNAVRHIDARHGQNGKADHSMGNIDDFSRIGFVLDNFTDTEVVTDTDVDEETAKLSREWRNQDGTRAPMVRYAMPVNGIYYVVEAVPDSKAKVMAVVSAYMTKKETPLNQVLNMDAGRKTRSPQPTSETPVEMLEDFNTTVPHNTLDVNAERNDSVGAASENFETPGSVSVERTSNLAGKALRYTRNRNFLKFLYCCIVLGNISVLVAY